MGLFKEFTKIQWNVPVIVFGHALHTTIKRLNLLMVYFKELYGLSLVTMYLGWAPNQPDSTKPAGSVIGRLLSQVECRVRQRADRVRPAAELSR